MSASCYSTTVTVAMLYVRLCFSADALLQCLLHCKRRGGRQSRLPMCDSWWWMLCCQIHMPYRRLDLPEDLDHYKKECREQSACCQKLECTGRQCAPQLKTAGMSDKYRQAGSCCRSEQKRQRQHCRASLLHLTPVAATLLMSHLEAKLQHFCPIAPKHSCKTSVAPTTVVNLLSRPAGDG